IQDAIGQRRGADHKLPRENKRRIRRSRKFAGAVTKKNGNGVITLVGHSEILVTIAVEVSRGNRSGVEAHANRDGFLKRAIAVAEEHVHGVRKRITGDQVMASAAGECRRSDSGKGRRRCAARSSQRNGRTGGLRKRDRKSTRLNSSHVAISYAVFCLKKKKGTLGVRPL